MTTAARLIGAGAMTLVLALAALPALACMLDEDPSFSRDTLNHYYPDALDVLSRTVEARRTGELPPPPGLPSSSPLVHLQWLMTSIRSLERQVKATAGTSETEPFALLLVESMLWSRFPAYPTSAPALGHVLGPEPGELVVVTGEDVVRQVVAGRITFAAAKEKGWLRLYGSGPAEERFLRAFAKVGAVPAAKAGPAAAWR